VARPELTFPLIPRHRLVGVAFGAAHSARRGLGSDVAGTRAYAPGDDVGAIDWAASARLSTARDSDEFVVRERFADEAPRVVVLCDRRPGMQLYGPGLPWLNKADAIALALDVISSSAYRARGLFGYLDVADGEEPYWTPPTSEPQWRNLEDDIAARPFTAAPTNVEAGLEYLRLARITLPPGSFVFVLSDLLVAPPEEAWLSVVEHGWDVVPVVIQDPTWEQTFPDVSGVVLPIVDADTGRIATVRLTRSQAQELRAAHERRTRGLLDSLAAAGAEPVLIGSCNPEAVLAAFLGWADRRLHLSQAWRVGAA
jgi:uncharacterized protein (DUF58 family)